MMRHVTCWSTTRSSWQRGPIGAMGREWGMPRFLPRCSSRSRYPASKRAACPKGGVFTSPCSQASGLSFGLTSGMICQR
jgi:hypothetical protein